MANTVKFTVKAIDKASGTLGKISDKVGGFTGIAKKGAAGVAILGTAIATAGGFALREASKFENLEKRFKVLLGTTEQAKARLEELNQFALSTPFQVEQVAQASAILQTFAGDALATGDGLRFVGDMAAFAQQPIDQVAIHAGRVVDALQSGRPFGESAQRMQELGLISGEARANLESFQGQTLSAQEALDLFKGSVTDVDGTMAELNDTITGQLSNVEQQFRDKLRGVGEIIAETFDVKETLRNFSEQISNIDLEPFRAFAEAAKEVIDAFVEELKDFVTFMRTKVVPPIIAAYKRIIDRLEDAEGDWEGVWESIKDTTEKVILFIVNKVIPVLEKTIIAIIDLVTFLKARWDENFLGIRTITETIIGGIVGFIGAAFDNLGFMFGAISSLLTGQWEALWINIKGIVSSAVNGIVSVINTLIGAINAIPGVSVPLVPKIETSLFNAQLEALGQKSVDTGSTYQDAFMRIGTTTQATAVAVEESSSSIVKEINKIGGGGGGGGARGAADDVEKATEKMVKDLDRLDDKFENTVDSINGKIKSLSRELEDLTEGFAQDRADARLDIASDIVESEERIGELTKKIAEEQKRLQEERVKLADDQAAAIGKIAKAEADLEVLKLKQREQDAKASQDKQAAESAVLALKNRILEKEKQIVALRATAAGEGPGVDTTNLDQLQADLLAEQNARAANNDFIEGLENEIAEVKRFNGLTALEQSIEQFNAEQTEAQRQFEEKLALLNEELDEVEKQKEELIEIEMEKQKVITELEKTATDQFKAELAQRVADAQAAAAQIERAFAKARAAARAAGGGRGGRGIQGRADGGPVAAGQTVLVGERGPELFTPASAGNVTPNEALGGKTVNVDLTFGDTIISKDVDADAFMQMVQVELTRAIKLESLNSI